MFSKKHIAGLALSLLLPVMIATAQADSLKPSVKLLTPKKAKHSHILRIIPMHKGMVKLKPVAKKK